MLALEDRLRGRGTEDETALEKRIAKSQQEMEAATAFDLRLVNDDLETWPNRRRRTWWAIS